jgi:hypothetical protein
MEILFAAIHFYDKRNHTPSMQHSLCWLVAEFLRMAEHDAGHERTVVVGDFNMNPFEDGMVDSNGFGAMMTRALTVKRPSAGGVERPLFYNPMWGRFGDTTEGPAGTFFHPGSGPINYYWNTLDQVLIRPTLLDAFRDEDLEVLTEAPADGGEIGLLTASRQPRPHPKIVSDHLPLLFKLNLTKREGP